MLQEARWKAGSGAPGHRNLPRWAVWLLYACAIYSFARSHILNTFRYISMQAYLQGDAKLPYQRRLLPMLVARALSTAPLSRSVVHRLNGRTVPPGFFPFFLVDLLSVAVSVWLCLKLYRKAAVRPRSAPLIVAIFLWTAAWTYMLSPESSTYYPYDLPGVAFFTAGLYFIYTRRFAALLMTLLVGTLNRETTLFLIPLLFLDAMALPPQGLSTSFWRRVPFVKLLVLTAAWVLVKLVLRRFYTHNDAADEFLRVNENLRLLSPNKWAQILCACGFLLPVVLYLRPRLADPRIRSYLLIIPIWVAVMFAFAVLTEIRVFGELCSLVTVATALLLDGFIEGCAAPVPHGIPLADR